MEEHQNSYNLQNIGKNGIIWMFIKENVQRS